MGAAFAFLILLGYAAGAFAVVYWAVRLAIRHERDRQR